MKYQQRPVDVFVWSGENFAALKEFVAPHTADTEGVVVRVNVRDCPDMLVPGDRILRDDAGTLAFVDAETFLAMYGEMAARCHLPKHVLVDFGNGKKLDIDVANTLVKDGECLRVTCGELGIVAEAAQYDELECTNGA